MEEKSVPRRAARGKKDLGELTRKMLSAKLPEDDSLQGELTARGLEATGAGLVLLGQLNKAAKGDTAAAKFLREMAEAPPVRKEPAAGGRDLSELSDRELLAILGRN